MLYLGATIKKLLNFKIKYSVEIVTNFLSHFLLKREQLFLTDLP